MSKDERGRELQKHTLFLFAGDFERLGELMPDVSSSKIVRHIIRKTIENLEGETPNVKLDI